MKIAIVGATGKAGSRIVSEALERGHSVVGIVRTPGTVPAREHLVAAYADANDPAALAPLLVGSDVVVSALRFVGSDPRSLIEAVKRAGVRRYLVVGGAGGLEVAPGKMLRDQPGFPAAALPESGAGVAFFDVLREERDLDWVFVAPSAMFAPGERTGVFRVGEERLLTDADGKSWISMEDYAIALVDEIEQPAHHRVRFTVGY
jgi:putative NADH-flavin reductase